MSVPAFEVLRTPRLVLRRLREEDAPVLAAYRSDPDVARFQGWGPTFSEDRARALVHAMRARQPGEDGWFQFAVAHGGTDELLGDVGLRTFEVRHAEIGFTLARTAQGRGYAAEAVRAVLAYAFGPLGVHRVVAGVDPRNERSSVLLSRLGFRHEGRFVESWPEGDGWLDEDRHALLAREFSARATYDGA
ncbi:GNAT family N-acetyltransferase [Deinococcus pimensis]|uniref:GNAT family N-acetyltransferase n=1 Tax=Deinococcus pimensis TaxID=309888 RepID=UPI0004857C1D|nr:GNAT family protein [Deinococcus pimensis]